MSLTQDRTEEQELSLRERVLVDSWNWTANAIADVVTAVTEHGEALGGAEGIIFVRDIGRLFSKPGFCSHATDFSGPMFAWAHENRFRLHVCPSCGDTDLGEPERHDNRQCPACRAWWTPEGDRA